MLVTHILDALLSGSPESATTVTQLTADPSDLCVGLSTVLTATVAAIDGDPTGQVHFYAGDVLLGSDELVSGTAQITTTELPVGVNTVTTYYDGDDTHDASQAEVDVTVIDDPEICGDGPPAVPCRCVFIPGGRVFRHTRVFRQTRVFRRH